MKLNPAKSLALRIRTKRKEKYVFLSQPSLEASSVLIRNLDTIGNFEYLGVRFGWKGITAFPHKQFMAGSRSYRLLPFKPHQRIELL